MIKIDSASDYEAGKVPESPGVYLYSDALGEIIYVGKAKNLRSRTRSYFSNSSGHSSKTQLLVSKIRGIDWIVVGTQVDALLLENKLVKQHQPKYNIDLRDSKTFAYIALTKDAYPRPMSVRGPSKSLEMYGPYTDGRLRWHLQGLVTKVYKLRSCKDMPKKACLNYYIGLCSAPCIGKISKEEYGESVQKAREFLSGNYEDTRQSLLSEMAAASKEQKYERALELRNQVESIQLLTERQVVDMQRDFDQDVIAFETLGEKVLVVHMGIRRGVLLGKKEFSLDLEPGVEGQFLKAYYETNPIPREILLNKACWEDLEEHYALNEFFSKKRGRKVELTASSRGDKLALVKLAEKNIESNLAGNASLVDLQSALNLPAIPNAIECFDVSNLGREHIVCGMVRYVNGKPDKSNYRRFKIRSVSGQDDFSSMHEAVLRRYRRLRDERAPFPDLIVVDGGRGQVSAAMNALKSLGLQVPLIGLAKQFEEIYLPGIPEPKRHDKGSRMMLLLRAIRDSAHNYSKSYNVKRREMKLRGEFASLPP